MKEIKAIIQPFMADHVVAALREMPELPGVTVSEVRGFRRGRAVGESQRQEVEIFCVKKVKLEIVVPDGLVETPVCVIQKNAHTGNPGDGKIFVCNVEEVVKIRTGERGEEAI